MASDASGSSTVADARFVNDLRASVQAGHAHDYLFFWSHRPPPRGGIGPWCLSQWYGAGFVLDGQHYPTAEHYMMAAKAALFDDRETRDRVLRAPTPGAAKALGREIRSFDEGVWVRHRFSIVVAASQAKFGQHAELGRFLQHTGSRVLVEASPHDAVWGIGLGRDDERASDPRQWHGLNLLGFALMTVRDAMNPGADGPATPDGHGAP